MARIERQTVTDVGKGVEHLERLCVAGWECSIGQGLWEIAWRFLRVDPELWMTPQFHTWINI